MAAPPGIGEAIGEGWKAAKPNLVPLIIGFLITGILSSFIVGILCVPGMMWMSLKAVRGQKPEIGDLFIGFKEGLVDHLIMILLQYLGFILCCVGIYITGPLFFQGTFLILDKKMKWGEAKDTCMAEIKPNLMGWIIFWFVVGLVGGLGQIACVIGILVTMPVAFCAMAYSYEKTLAGGGGAAPAPAK
jgi:uncharacterized membrane protein